MENIKKAALPVFLAGIWVNVSEFTRNELLLKTTWVEHYNNLNLEFPSDPVNGIAWIIWGFAFAVLVFAISQKFTLIQTLILSWLAGFGLMWIIIWNLDVLPDGLLIVALPLSLVEAFVAAWICKRFSKATNDF